MKTTLFGLFHDSQKAGEAVSELKDKGYAKEISLLAHDEKYENAQMHEVKKDASDGTTAGATIGAVTGALAAIFSGITSLFVPGVGLVVGGPLVAMLGLAGGTVGSLAGGLVGGLVDLGINEPTAQLYDKAIRAGDVLVAVSSTEEGSAVVRAILVAHGATDIVTVQQ